MWSNPEKGQTHDNRTNARADGGATMCRGVGLSLKGLEGPQIYGATFLAMHGEICNKHQRAKGLYQPPPKPQAHNPMAMSMPKRNSSNSGDIGVVYQRTLS